MFDALRDFFDDLVSGFDESDGVRTRTLDPKLCAAALMVQVMVADGKVRPEERDKLQEVLQVHYDLTASQAKELAAQAEDEQRESIDLYRFTSVLRSEMDEAGRRGVIEDLWEMVYADGKLHEFEDNVVWRVAELLHVPREDRLAMKRNVRDQVNGEPA